MTENNRGGKMTPMQKLYLERISDLSQAIFMIVKNANTTETESVKTLLQLIDESVENITKEEAK